MTRLWIVTDADQLHTRMPRALVRALCTRGIEPHVVVSDRGTPSWRRLEPGDLVVARTRTAAGLALLEAAELHGARAFERVSALRTARNKAQATLALARAGVAVPATIVAYAPEQAARLGLPLLLKPVFRGAGAVRAIHTRAELARAGWDGTPRLAQAHVPSAGVETHLYVAGEEVWALRRPSPLLAHGACGRPVAVTPALRELALGCAGRLGLRLAAVAALDSPGGPVVVDVEPFPDYAGVPEAPDAVAATVIARLALNARSCGR